MEEKEEKNINTDIKDLNKQVEADIAEAVKQLNDACETLGKNNTYLQHIALVGYFDNGLAQGFIAASNNLESLESRTTFLLDYMSRDIKDAVHKRIEKQAEAIKETIKDMEERKEEDNDGKQE